MCQMSKFVLYTLFAEIALCKFLLFPTTNPLYKLIAGFGVPIQDLDYESVLVGNVFKARFHLPASAKQLRTHDTVNIKGRSSIDGHPEYNSTNSINSVQIDATTLSEDYTSADSEEHENGEHHKNSGYRWAIYKGLEAFGDRMGLIGRACVLKSICETAEIPFHYHNGIYAEVLHILFTPSSSVDKLSTHSDNEYLHAEKLGKSGAPCERVFKDCKQSLLDRFSDIYDMTHGLYEKFIK